MAIQVFINLPVADLIRSMEFYSAIGFENNPQFTDETAACMVLSDEIFVMLLTHKKFRDFTKKEIADTQKSIAVINALGMESVEKMNDMAEKALAAGGRESYEPKDYGFMQQRTFEDPDGHNWEVFYMDMSKLPTEG
jgi:predicted lactoylglutathione lyase